MNYFALVNQNQPVAYWTVHHQRASDELWEIIEPLGVKTSLDCGCGTDPSPTLEMLRSHIDAIGLDLDCGDVKGDMHFLPFKDNSFDLVLSRHSLEHCLCPPIALMEMRRVAEYVLVVVPESNWRWALWKGHWSIFPREVWEILFLRVGFTILRLSHASFSQPGENSDIEWRYLLQRSEPFDGPFGRDGAFREWNDFATSLLAPVIE